jgi:hypothetical protein
MSNPEGAEKNSEDENQSTSSRHCRPPDPNRRRLLSILRLRGYSQAESHAMLRILREEGYTDEELLHILMTFHTIALWWILYRRKFKFFLSILFFMYLLDLFETVSLEDIRNILLQIFIRR